MASSSVTGEHLVLYDGVCGLCNRLIQFVLRRDPRGLFDFASLQSATGQDILRRFGRNADAFDTVYVLTRYRSDGGSALLSKADAALFVVGSLGPRWRWLGLLRVLPKALRDWGYDVVAGNRYRLFGRYESCLMPSAEFKKRFIDL